MKNLNFSFQNIVDGQGFGLSFTGLTIVFISLVSISLFIFTLPHFLKILDKFYPEKEELVKTKKKQNKDSLDSIAAIAYAIHQNKGAN